MGKTRLLSCALLLAVLCAGFGTRDATASPPRRSFTGGADAASVAERDGSVRVIVGLDTSFRPEGRLSSVARKDQRTRIAAKQEAVRADLSGTKHRHIRTFSSIPYMVVSGDGEAIDALRDSHDVSSIQIDRISRPFIPATSRVVGADDMWRAGKTGSGKMVAVLDTGVQKSHPFFAGRVTEEACYSNAGGFGGGASACPNGQPTQTGSGSGVNCSASIDGCGHGTHVAGIVAADYINARGVAKAASIMSVQVFTKFTGTECTDYDVPSPCIFSFASDQIAGLERVFARREAQPIAAVNMSLGGGLYGAACDEAESATKHAIDNLLSAGIPTIVAAGNEGFVDAVGAPGCITSAITVGSTNKEGTAISAFTNNHPTLVDVMAPGENIISSVPGGSYGYETGTSMAAPHVAGAFALLRQHKPGATVDEILSALQSTGHPIVDTWAEPDIVHPRISIFGATTALGGCTDMPYDVGNTLALALPVKSVTAIPGLICPGDVDYYKWGTNAGSTLTVFMNELEYTNGDINVVVEDPLGAVLATANSATSRESLSVVTQTTGPHFVKVYGDGDDTGGYALSLQMRAPVTVYLGGGGSVTGPHGTCPPSCVHPNLLVGSTVTLTATPRSGWRFSTWTGACAGTSRTCAFVVRGPSTAVAIFKRV